MPQGLAAEVSAQTADFQAGMATARRGLDGLARDATSTNAALDRAGEAMDSARNDAFALGAAMVGAQAAADELGDELSGVGRSGLLASGGLTSASGSAASTGGAFSALTVSTNGLALSFGSLTTSVAGAVTILGSVGAVATGVASSLVTLATTVTGLTAGAGALAGAFGAVIGSGALAYGEQLNEQYQEQLLTTRDRIEELEALRETQGHLTDSQRERLRQLKEEEKRLDDVEGPLSALQVRLGDLGGELATIIADWGREFAPLIRDAINAVPALTRNILDAVGGLDRFGSALRSFGRESMSLLPMVAGELANLARESLPLLVDGMQWLRTNGGSIFDTILATTREVAPLLQDIGAAFVDALPSINRFGTAVLKTALPAIERGIRGFGNLLDEILAFSKTKQFDEIMTALRNGAEELGPELQMLRYNLSSLLQTAIEYGPEFVAGFTAIADTVLDVINGIAPVINGFLELVGVSLQKFRNWQQRSERISQRLDSGDYAGAIEQTLRSVGSTGNARGMSPTGRLDSEREVRIVVDSRDEKFRTYIDGRIEQDSRESFDALDRGAHRGG